MSIKKDMLKDISPSQLTTLATLIAQDIASNSTGEEINAWRLFFGQISSVLAAFNAQDCLNKKKY